MKDKLILINFYPKDLGKLHIHKRILKIVMKVTGKKEKCMEKVNYHGRINLNMKGNMFKVLKRGQGNFTIHLEKSTMDSGKLENKMVRESCMIKLELKRNEGYGRVELVS